MSGRQAKAARKAAEKATTNWKEAILQIHDRIHKGEIEAAHEMCHEALGSGRVTSDVAPLGGGPAEFDRLFRELCISTRTKASYVAGVPVDDDGQIRVLTGGDQELDAIVCGALQETIAP